jgi:hypothetical protein
METAGFFPTMPFSILFHLFFLGIQPTKAFVFESQRAHQPPAQPGDLGRVDDNLLLLCLLDGHRLEAFHETEAAKRTSANAKPSHHLRLIPDSNLAHLNSHLELLGQVFHQLPKINSAVGSVIKNSLFLVKKVADHDQFHRQISLFDSLQAKLEGASFFSLKPAEFFLVIFSGLPYDLD